MGNTAMTGPEIQRLPRAFSLVELVVAIAILGVLIALLLPALQKARQAGLRVQCANNLRQLDIGCHTFEGIYKRFPLGGQDPRFVDGQGWKRDWLDVLLPFVEQSSVFQLPFPTRVATPVANYVCPADFRAGSPILWSGANVNGSATWACTDYVAIEGLTYKDGLGVMNFTMPVSIAGIVDGTSNTIAIGERPPSIDLHWGWWGQGLTGADASTGVANQIAYFTQDNHGNPCPGAPYNFGSGPQDPANPCSFNQLWSSHDGGGNFAFADGSVRFLTNASAAIMPALATRAGGEAVTMP